ncbi:hypothetical protein D3874_19860 [Oleomonas cavernae]|uniref:DUF3108 domain-containing protein n=1 Tax=Oleomonas cavernae TaxID=2320859 RepID=A0A418WG02_9PROT|nr:hypothetical protein [Oleomonas cavernae]RJF88953.1 hypothetical protein D3874_19860 [Oleomonas cavernae]
MRLAALGLLIAAGAAPAWAQDANRLDGQTAVTIVPAVGETGPRMQTVSRDYHRAYYYGGADDQRYLLVEVETTQLHDLYSSESSYPPTAQRVLSIRDAAAAGLGPVKAQWTVEADAITVPEFAQEPVIAENYGCCDSFRTLRSLDLLTGKMLSVRSDNVPVPVLRLFGRDTVAWTVEVLTVGAQLDVDILGEDNKTVAQMILLGDGRPVQRLRLESVATGRTVDDMPALEHVMGWALKAGGEAKPVVEVPGNKAADPLLVWIIADYPMEKPSRLEIPLVSGRLDTTRAKLPRGFKLLEQPLD